MAALECLTTLTDLWTLMCGTLTFREDIKWPSDMDPVFKNFLEGLLQKDPKRRMSWPHLLYHPFVSDGELSSPSGYSHTSLPVATVTPLCQWLQPHLFASGYSHTSLPVATVTPLSVMPYHQCQSDLFSLHILSDPSSELLVGVT